MILIKVILVISFLIVFYQDFKDRAVNWILFPVITLCLGIIMYQRFYFQEFVLNIALNLLFILILLLVLKMIVALLFNLRFFKTIGLGDILLFIALTFAFPPLTFRVFFIFGLVFSLLLYMVMKHKSEHKTVPLAGNLSLFFAFIHGFSWIGLTPNLYLI